MIINFNAIPDDEPRGARRASESQTVDRHLRHSWLRGALLPREATGRVELAAGQLEAEETRVTPRMSPARGSCPTRTRSPRRLSSEVIPATVATLGPQTPRGALRSPLMCCSARTLASVQLDPFSATMVVDINSAQGLNMMRNLMLTFLSRGHVGKMVASNHNNQVLTSLSRPLSRFELCRLQGFEPEKFHL